LRFQVEKDPFFDHEESRFNKIKSHERIMKSESLNPIYLTDLEFPNIKKIQILLKESLLQNSSSILHADIYIYMDKPANC